MKKIVFINPAMDKSERIRMWNSGAMGVLMNHFVSTVPRPIGMIFAAITPDRYDFTYIDEEIEDIDFAAGADLVAITAMTAQANRAYQIADRFRESGVPVVIGGIHASVLPDEVSGHCDAIFIGEGENTWPAMLDDMERNAIKKVYDAKDYPPVEYFVSPRIDVIRHDRYMMYPILATRGCPYDCDFCSVKFSTGRKYRMKPVGQVVEEIKELEKHNKKVLGAYKKSYFFMDDNLYVNREYVKELFTAMRGLGIAWSGQGTVNMAFDDEILSLMSESGCRSYNIGFESLSEGSLSEVNKPSVNKAENYASAIENLIRHGIIPAGYFIFGFDNDDLSVFQKTVDFAEKNHLMQPYFTVLTPYPGTRLYDRMASEGRIFDHNWDHYNSSKCVFTPKQMSKSELEGGMIWACKQLAEFGAIKSQLAYFWDKGPWPGFSPINLQERMALFAIALKLGAYNIEYSKYLLWAISRKNTYEFGTILTAISLHDITMRFPDTGDFTPPVGIAAKNS